ncbi:hypothetical protein BDZ90DRAFT_279680 [Jaminaea rosea]|uniref:P-loop containing nucleoside triphosphate hydrolase protein n=1 Tax=Jaminaea rosea TaxID=1569628 RepID=A0A316UPU5_9BASI|nr:hypothetical protein BDZ90DRAFT_279680 [Jaminaea rosea]PWN27319.1 hypothetical protein BDZ90DRAFT_279680 [Jaminaea rosea]
MESENERPQERRALVARLYQEELFKRGKEGNTIACIETGTGKTMIAAMLIEHMMAAEQIKPLAQRRLAIFAVPLVPLVHQQATFIDANTEANVEILCGEIETECSTRKWWDDNIDRGVDVVVCTAQVFLNALSHAYLSLSSVNLIVFDEAHHVVGDDVYRRIMDHYRLLLPRVRPKIFGMTASPLLTSTKSLEVASSRLESILDSKIFALSPEAREELSIVSNHPTELVIEYDRAPNWADISSRVAPAVRTRLVAEFQGKHKDFEKLLGGMDWHWEELGPAFSDLAWLSSKQDILGKAAIKEHYARVMETTDLVNPQFDDTSRAAQLRDSAYFRRQVVNFLDDIPVPDIIELHEGNASPKLLRFIQALECFKPHAKEFCGMIFTGRRVTAIALQMLIERSPSLSSWIHSEALVGHSGGGMAASFGVAGQGMTWEQQNDVLMRFRRRDPTNLVIATSVLEEGLDITPVNCVIRFDLPNHHVGYVQSRGRARAQDSTYLLFAEKHNKAHLSVIKGVIKAESDLQQWLRAQPDDRKMPWGERQDEARLEREAFLHDERSGLLQQRLVIESTGACVFPIDTVAILAHYVALLRTDEFCATRPHYEMQDNGCQHGLRFKAKLHLPANSPLTLIEGPLTRSKKAARRLAAFEAVHQLHQLSELDDHLAPKQRPKTFPEVTAALHYNLKGIGEIVDGVTPKNTLSFAPKLPPVFDTPGIKVEASVDVYRSELDFPGVDDAGEAFHPLALITKSALPCSEMAPITFASYQGQPSCELPILGQAQSMRLGEQQLLHARIYTLRLLALISSRLLEGKEMPYLILPLDKETREIDWQAIDAASEGSAISKVPRHPEEHWVLDKLVLDSPRVGSGARAFRALKVDHDKTPLSKIPGREGEEGAATTYWDDAVARKMRQENVDADNMSPSDDQPLIEAVRLAQRLDNYLVPMQRRAKSTTASPDYLIPQLTWQHSITASVFESARMVPSYLAGLEHALNARELNEHLFSLRLDPTQTSTALTAPSAGLPYNNQRLEFLGDVFLKAISCAYVFARSDKRLEGHLHLDAREVLSNSSLVEKTKDFQLGTVLCTRSFTRRNWCPPLLEATNREPIDPTERLNHVSPKMLADIVESLIGAAVSTTSGTSEDGLWLNVDLGLFACVRLGILPSEIKSIDDIAKRWREQVEPKAIAERWNQRPHRERLKRLEEIWGHHFNMPHLALEALTHPGHLNSALPSYQRLEFLGDGLLDLFIDAWLFKRFTHFDEGELTAFKGMLVSNKALSALCEATKLYKYLQTDFQPSLMSAIQATTAELKYARERVDRYVEQRGHTGDDEAKKQPKPALHYWIGRPALKALADIVEASLGAVFVDSGFCFQTAWRMFSRVYMPWYERYATVEAYEQRLLIEEQKRQEGLARRAEKTSRMEE